MSPAGTIAAKAAPAPAESALYSFASAIREGDPSLAAAYFTREGTMITPDGTAVHGRADVTALLFQLTARRTEIEVEQLVVRLAGDVALATGRLRLRSDGPAGARIEQSCSLNLVLRHLEGAWKIAVLSPWATV